MMKSKNDKKKNFTGFLISQHFKPIAENSMQKIIQLTEFISDCDYICSLKTLTSPLLILHSEDDNVIPYHMSLKVGFYFKLPFPVLSENFLVDIAVSC